MKKKNCSGKSVKIRMNNLNLFYQVLTDSKASYSILKYLDIQDLNSFYITSSIILNIINTNKIRERCLLESSENSLFFLENKFEIINDKKIHSAWDISDKLYNKFYSQSHFVIKCFYFSFLILGVDLTSLLTACVKIDNSSNWITQIPLIFHWFISVLLLMVYVLRYRNMKKKIKILIEETIHETKNKYIPEKILLVKKLTLRMKNKQPIAFVQIALLFIIFYLPIMIKIFMEKFNSSYRKAFWASSALIFIYLFLQGLIKIIFKKIKHYKNKHYLYKQLYHKGKSEFYQKKMKVLKSSQKRSFCGEIVLLITFFLMKIIIYLVMLFYLDCLGTKLDNFAESYSWFVLFSPVYVILFFVVSWGILYCYSIRKYAMLYKGRLYLTIFLILLCLIGNSVLIPLKLENHIHLSNYWPFGIFCIASVSVFYHYYLLKIQNRNEIITR